MRSYQIVEFGQPLQPRDYPTPEPQGTEVLVRVRACGVCHSDLHLWDGYFDLGGGKRITLADRGTTLPFTLGHEVVGEVAAVGPDAADVAVGDRRVVYPWVGCGQCDVCRRGDELLCLTPRHIGTRRHGGYSDHVMVPHPRYLVEFEGVPEEVAATYACSGLTAYAALKKLPPLRADDFLLMIGAGGVGMAGIGLAPAVTKARVIVADIDDTKLAAARQAGASETINSAAPDAVEQLRKITGGGVMGAIDYVGSPASVQFGIDSLRKGGALVMVGLYGGALPVSLPMFTFKLMRIIGSFVGTLDELKELMAIVRSGGNVPVPITVRPLAEASQALSDLKAGKVLGRQVLRP